MSKDDVIEVEGKVIEVLPNTKFIVELANSHKSPPTYPESLE